MTKFKSFASSHIGYFADKVYDFSLSEEAVPNKLIESSGYQKRIMVMGREHYHESVRDYPVGNAKDLKRILASQINVSPYESYEFFLVDRLSDDSHRVTSWHVKHTSIEGLTYRPWILVPESACVSIINGTSGLIKITRPSGSLTVGVENNGLVSYFNSEKGDLSNTTYSDSLAQLSTGSSSEPKALSAIESTEILWDGVLKLLSSFPLRFMLPFDRSVSTYPWMKALKLSGLMFGCYLFASSGFIMAIDYWADSRLDKIESQAADAVETRRQLRARHELLDKMNNIVGSLQPNWIPWEIFLDLKKSSAQFSVLSFSNGQLDLTGTAPRATDILLLLADDRRVNNAEFNSPVRKSRDLELFAISADLDYSLYVNNNGRGDDL